MTPSALTLLCRKYGPLVNPLPPDVDGPQLLWAMSGVESSFGRNLLPRHESAYDRGGKYALHPDVADLLKKYGSAAACSYGPWQIMFPYTQGFTPKDLMDPENAAQATVAFLNSDLRRFNPKTLAEIGSIWNAGHICSDKDYTDKLEFNYGIKMPQ